MKNIVPGVARPESAITPPEWITGYAALAVRSARLPRLNLTGRGHVPRVEVPGRQADSAEHWLLFLLPKDSIVTRQNRSDARSYRTVTLFAQAHVEWLDFILAECGYDRERQKIVSPTAAIRAQVWLRLNPGELLPGELAKHNRHATERALAALERRETAEIARATAS